VRGWAFGVLGLSRRELYEMRPGEFWEALSAHNEEVLADRRHLGELVRGATLRLFNLQVAQKHKMKDPAKFWPMPWDVPKEVGEQAEIHRLEHLDEAGRQEEVNKFLSRLNNGTGTEHED
jgi:hypothetical protein